MSAASGGSRSGTRPEVVFALAASMLMIAQHVAARASRDALFLSYFDATNLPYVMIASAVVSIGSTLAFSRWMGGSTPVKVVPLGFALSAVALVAEWILVLRDPTAGAIALYLHVAAFGAVLISGFWSVINERFDPHSGKRTVSRIAAAATFGGIIGGVTADRVAAFAGLPAMLLGMALMHGLCAIFVRGIGSAPTKRRSEPTATSFVAGFQVLRQTPYLQQMAGLVALTAVVDALLDYALKAQAAEAFVGGEALIQFFAIFYTMTGVAAFLLQVSLGTPVLRKFGLAGAMAFLPVSVIVAGSVATASSRMITIALTRAVATMTSNSLFRVGFELLYNPVSPKKKRPAKIFVDVGARRLGDLAGSGFILLLLALLPGGMHGVLMATVVAFSVAVGAVIWFLQRGYVQQLAGSLRSGLVAIDQDVVMDATTARTVAATQVALDRGEILELIRERQGGDDAESTPPSTPAVTPPSDASGPKAVTISRDDDEITAQGVAVADEPAVGIDPIAERVAAIYSPNREDVWKALSSALPTDPRLVGHVVAVLPRRDVAEDSLAFLRRASPMATGQLVDWLLDPTQPPVTRRRLARLLQTCDDARAVDGLRRALELPHPGARSAALEEFDVRRQCAQSAARLVAHTPAFALPRGQVHDIVLQELRVVDGLWNEQGERRADVQQASVLLDTRALERISRSIEHVFTVLSMAYEREVMASTLGGLYSEDDVLRGTALEYIDVRLPDELRAALTPRLEHRPTPPRPARQVDEMADELLKSSVNIVIDPGALRKRN